MQQTRRAVLAALSDGPVSGPTLAEELDVSRAAVWKQVEALREAGFVVESTDDGYVLGDVPEYGGLAIEYGLEAPFEVEFHEELDSTNRRARDLAADGAEDVVVVAATQTGGRGRLDREWSSPPGGVYMSLVCRPDLPPAQVPVYTLAAAVAVTRAAREAGVDARIKWPNDVLVPRGSRSATDGASGERAADWEEAATERTVSEASREQGDPREGGDPAKLCGILTEMEGEADRVSWVVVGIGVNVNTADEHLVDDATSVRREAGPAERRTFVQRVLEEFDALRNAPEEVIPAWREHALTLGQRVRVETPTDEVVGEAVDVEFPGTLVVETDAGTRRVAAGDCEHLRPT